MPAEPLSLPRHIAFVGHRLGAPDGISAASSVWQRVAEQLGCKVTTVAGEGAPDHLVPGLGRVADLEPDGALLSSLLADADVVVVENCLSAPRNPGASAALERILAGRPAVLRHHDLAWQPSGGTLLSELGPATDPAWRHVTINERSRLELAARGVTAETFYNCFDIDAPRGDRMSARAVLGVASDSLLLLQPTRAVATKNIAGGLLLAAGLGATYWLLGGAEDGYDAELERLVARARTPVIMGRGVRGTKAKAATQSEISLADAYAASDAVVLPSTWEGFGNAAVESAVHHRPFAIGSFAVGMELRRYGFSWFEARDPARLSRHLRELDPFVAERNELVARKRFGADQLVGRLGELLTRR